VTSGVPQVLILGLALFVEDIYSGTECTLSKFADDTKLSDMIDMLQRKDTIQRDLGRLKRWACANLMKFSQAKCRVLHMGQGNRKHKYRLVGEWIESSPEKKDLGVLVEQKLSMTQQCVLATQKANCTLGCIKSSMDSRSRRGFCPSTVLCPTWSLVSSSGVLSTGETWTCWSGSRGGPQK